MPKKKKKKTTRKHGSDIHIKQVALAISRYVHNNNVDVEECYEYAKGLVTHKELAEDRSPHFRRLLQRKKDKKLRALIENKPNDYVKRFMKETELVAYEGRIYVPQTCRNHCSRR